MSPAKLDRVVITENPRLHPGALCQHKIDEGLFRRFYGKDATLFYFGRGALWHAIRSLHLSASDNVLVPSYHCGVEIEAVSMAGVRLRYYDVQEDFSIDLSDLHSRIDADTKAILLIHYFGFPQPVEAIKAICTAGNITLVEDCSQALFSSFKGKPLGTFGDLAVFSQRKTLPLPDGGALLINNPSLTPDPPGNKPSNYVAVKKMIGMLFRSIFNLNPRNELPYIFERMAAIINSRVARKEGSRYSTGMEVDSDRCSLDMSGPSRYIMDRTRIEPVIRRRRDNYLCLLRHLTGVPHFRIVREQLPEGACPLFFPVRIEGVGRHVIQERLLRSGINGFVFGDELHAGLPRNQFRNAEMLSREVLSLPVHQDLKPADMAYIAETLRQAGRELDHADSH
ncbi:MAG TPA: aminotransferase class V-fold PLP-dependent enzyme [Dongiaceae bacterium]|nr:aminotransferase class V-fold PLP-dependent enzyme [Dongiaceae bacterium]